MNCEEEESRKGYEYTDYLKKENDDSASFGEYQFTSAHD